MLGIHFKPGKDHTGVDQSISDIQPALSREMHVLSTPDHHQFQDVAATLMSAIPGCPGRPCNHRYRPLMKQLS